MIDADAHPAGIVGDVVDAKGRGSPRLRDDEVVDANLFGRALRAPLTPGVLEVADQFFFLVSMEIAG